MLLTHAQIQNAQNNDLDAVSAVIAETEGMLNGRARRMASTEGHADSHTVDDLVQVGRIAVWEALSSFTGTEPAQFVAYVDRAVSRAMADARRESSRPGVAPRVVKAFETAIALAGGDPYDAERVAATDALGADKMSPELAYAARLSWMGLESLDAPAPSRFDTEGETLSLGDVIAREMEMPTELVEPRDVAAHRRAVIRDHVHRALGGLSERQRHVVKAGFGISPVPEYRPGVDDDELAAELSVTRYQVQQARTKGAKRFAELYAAGVRAW
ncbi:sigma-70 family RNA polymerase sigma factor [Streptomyces sp. NPDC001552]|uniref:sigma-70 family RNA polymerase sigma factor n=1 Tax=Streptomyces sp. NPDC001552 TaxID=3364587 RepID=UPI00369EF03F